MNKKVIILFTLSLLFPDKSSADIQVDINKKNNEIESLKLEIQKVETLIENKSKEEKINNDLVKQIDNKIKLTEKLIKTLTNEENYLTKQIYLAEENISIKENITRPIQMKIIICSISCANFENDKI